MKNLLVIFLILLIFSICAVIGYNAANRFDLPTFEAQQAPTNVAPGEKTEQHNFIIVQVDQLGVDKPRLVSVWFASLFFMEGTPPTLTFAQLYSPFSNGNQSRSLERAFSLTSSGEPSAGFWRSVRSYKIKWEAYFVVDQNSTQRMLEWVNGPADFISPFFEPEKTQALVQQTCQSLAGLSSREAPAFDWTGLAPEHFRSNLRMEIGLAYWNRMVVKDQQLRCEVIVAQ